ncbi:unnamed protein product [Dicrocoelium dendriticum]|nr:unnamed protein product [Dicrocoelium dendriticum]
MTNCRSVSLPQAICSPKLFARHTQLTPESSIQIADHCVGYNNSLCVITTTAPIRIITEPVEITQAPASKAVSLIAISPYHASDGFLYHSTTKSETGVSTRTHGKCHFRRRVARSQYNKRRTNSSSIRDTDVCENTSLKSKSNCAEPPKTCVKSNSTCFSRIENAKDKLIRNSASKGCDTRRAVSVDLYLKRTHASPHGFEQSNAILTSEDQKSYGSEPYRHIDHMTFLKRIISTPLISQMPNQTMTDDAKVDTVPHIKQPRSRSHHQLMLTSIARQTAEVTDSSSTGIAAVKCLPVAPNGCITDRSNFEDTSPDPWYHRYYTVSTHSDRCTRKMLRSPISVLANCKGKLRINIECHKDNIRLDVIEAKGLRSTAAPICHSFVMIELMPDKNHLFAQKTPVVENTCNPVFNKTVTLDLYKIKHCRRIIISVYRVSNQGDLEKEFLGGMSFGVSGIFARKQISGWYFLLNETMARKKHLKAAVETTMTIKSTQVDVVDAVQSSPVKHITNVTTNTPSASVNLPVLDNIPFKDVQSKSQFPTLAASLSPAKTGSVAISAGSMQQNTFIPANSYPPVQNMQFHQFLLSRGSRGFGFTLVGCSPVYVSHVEQQSPAHLGGIQAGDLIIAINHLNVSGMNADSVVKMFRTAQHPLYVTVGRISTFPIRMPPVTRNGSASRSLTQLFSKSCFSQPKKTHNSCAAQPLSKGDTAARSSNQERYSFILTTPVSPQPDYNFQYMTSGTPSNLQRHSNLSSSQSSYQLTTGAEAIASHFSTSLMDGRLCDANGTIKCTTSNSPTNSILLGPQNIPPMNPLGQKPCSSFKPAEPWPFSSQAQPVNSKDARLITLPLLDTCNADNKFMMNSKIPLGISWLDNSISTVENLKYLNHIKHVDFRVHSPRLEHYGCLNLLECNTCSKVDLLMFPDLLLIAQKAPNRFFTVIKDPIYNSKMCYVNIPPYASDQLILQYIDDDNRKQIVHFQGSNVYEWLLRIQAHMLYNGNWWMSNMSCAPGRF